MSVVAMVAHHHNPRAAELCRQAISWLQDHQVTVRVLVDDALALDLAELAAPAAALAAEASFVLSIGGDGTMLRAVDQLGALPVLGVNAGLLGYLTEVEPDRLTDALARVLAGDHQIEERMMLAIRVERSTGALDDVALNEVVVEKAHAGHTIRLRVSIGGSPFTVYAADGLIVATPTGSTAYALSAGGPIVSPRHRALLLTPVAPHMLFDRTLVLDPDETVELELLSHTGAAVSADGRMLGPLGQGERVRCATASRPARFITFGGRDFHQILKKKFGLTDR